MTASRVLLDTNVLVSAAVFGGKPRSLLELAEIGRYVLVSSVHILGELAEVLSRPAFGQSPDDVANFVEAIARLADVVPVEGAPFGECRDPDDEPVLLAAVLGKADIIVSGDRDLLALSSPPVPVITVDVALRSRT